MHVLQLGASLHATTSCRNMLSIVVGPCEETLKFYGHLQLMQQLCLGQRPVEHINDTPIDAVRIMSVMEGSLDLYLSALCFS